jgi:hypothetical protein
MKTPALILALALTTPVLAQEDPVSFCIRNFDGESA